MRRHVCTLFALGWLVADLAGCGSVRPPISASEDVYETPLVGPCDPGDAVRVTRYEQDGRRLFLEVQHTGGCEQHTYVACLEDPHPHGEPVYTLTVHHEARGDRCEAELTRVLRIELDRDLRVRARQSDSVTLVD